MTAWGIGALLAASLAGSSGSAVGPSVPAVAPAMQVESLLVAGQRLARAWARHDFDTVVAGATDLTLDLPGAPSSAPLRPDQAAVLLRGFTDGTDEISVEVQVARDVNRDRAYVEVQRVFVVRGAAGRRIQTIYFALRRQGSGYRLTEVRILS